jgi:hypothetical protein
MLEHIQVLDGSAGISNLLMLICFARSIGQQFLANRRQR